MTEKKKKRKKTVGDYLRMIIFLVALGVFCYAFIQLITIYLEYKKGVDEYSAIEESYTLDVDPDAAEGGESVEEDGQILLTMKNPIDFASIQEQNPDIVAWIKMKGIDISYPVAYGSDNEYYLHHTMEKTYNFAGCIFIEHSNKKNLSDDNTILYGHNMKNGSMFGKLKYYSEQDAMETSPYFWLYTKEHIYKYEIFSSSIVGATSDAYTIRFGKEESFQKYLDKMVEQSRIKTDVKVTSGDKIVTLSTCTGNDATRCIVQGKLIETYKSINQ